VPDDHCRPSTALVTIQPAFTDAERLALAGFLAGYRGLTREAYALDLRQFTGWCRARSLPLFAVRRADIEGFARNLEARGRARATVTRRLCTIARLQIRGRRGAPGSLARLHSSCVYRGRCQVIRADRKRRSGTAISEATGMPRGPLQ
jgi:integrase family protein with SAM-like domain